MRTVYYDPYQMSRSATTLIRDDIRMQEYPQSTGNLTKMAELDLLKGQNLVLYRSKELREHALNTVAIETTRGWRLAKEKSAKKIDSTIALAMAAQAGLDFGKAQLHEADFDGITVESYPGPGWGDRLPMNGIISLADALHGSRERRIVVRGSDGKPADVVTIIDGDRPRDETYLGDDSADTQKFLKIRGRRNRLA